MNTKKVVILSASVVSALLVAAIIVMVVILNTMNAQAADERYRSCMASQGFGVGSGAGVTTDEEVDAYLDSAVEAAEFCRR